MWIAKIRYKHDCLLGNRCQKFGVTLQSVAFSVFKDKGKTVTSSLHQMNGEKQNEFIADLQKDPRVIKIERKGSTFLLIEKAKQKAVRFFTPKMIFIKPILMDKKGWETWEVGSWEKEEVAKFVNHIKKDIPEMKLLKFNQTPLDQVFFPRLMPDLTEKQKKALDLAIEEGYYQTPRKTELRKLAKLMKISLATYQQHLRVAEEKLIPNMLSYFK
ncbi:MAG: helix-turn-helix domain-containing protein [Candidatus Woesearchaeota archaeon]